MDGVIQSLGLMTEKKNDMDIRLHILHHNKDMFIVLIQRFQGQVHGGLAWASTLVECRVRNGKQMTQSITVPEFTKLSLILR